MKFSTKIKIIKFFKKIFDKIAPYSVQDFILRRTKQGTFLSQVEFHLVDNCNLNCAHCDHFTPLAKENFVEIDKILNDFKKLKKVFDNVGKIYILGGEPLLHPNLLDIFEPLRNLYPKSEIIIISNGILLNKQGDNFWESLKKYDIALSMTKYPIKVDYDYYIQKCKDMGIKCHFFDLNRDKMMKLDLDLKGENDKQKAFDKCWRKGCHFLRDSKLWMCTPAPNIRFLNEYFNLDFKIDKSDYVDLNKVKSASRINAMFQKPIEFCRYCNDKEYRFDKYRISKKELAEWVRED